MLLYLMLPKFYHTFFNMLHLIFCFKCQYVPNMPYCHLLTLGKVLHSPQQQTNLGAECCSGGQTHTLTPCSDR